jgi:hypothetical protein
LKEKLIEDFEKYTFKEGHPNELLYLYTDFLKEYQNDIRDGKF